MRLAPLLVATAALIAGGCGASDDDAGDTPPAGSGLVQRVSVQQAAGRDGWEGVVIVEGGLLADGETVRLCSAFAESYPPQCGRPSIAVQGLDLAQIDGLETASGISWKERVSLAGVLRDGVLTAARDG